MLENSTVIKFRVLEVHQFKGTKTTLGTFDTYPEAVACAQGARYTATFKPTIVEVQVQHPLIQHLESAAYQAQYNYKRLDRELDTMVSRLERAVEDVKRAQYELRNTPKMDSRYGGSTEERVAADAMRTVLSMVGNLGTDVFRTAADSRIAREELKRAAQAVIEA